MTTPRRTRLIRVPDLRAFRTVIANLADRANPDVVVLVPTRGAARQLPGMNALTRDELYDELHARLSNPPRRLTLLERDVMAQAAARAAAEFAPLTFQLRPGLVAEMLRFYDQLRRQSQVVDRFEELIDAALGFGGPGEGPRSDPGEGPRSDHDRGAVRMRQQTRFLAGSFREYERRVRESGGCDEHLLRERLLAEPAAQPLRHVAVTVADWIADADGLFVADFDLLSRLPGLESIDIVATVATLGSGFHQRLHDWWPGLEEGTIAAPAVRPALQVPPGSAPDEPWWTHRDREEELVAIVRHLKADERRGEAVPLERTAVVFKNPLPYLYLAAGVFGSAGIPYRASDALPLAAEPSAAALDLVFEAVATSFSRSTLVALLRSPHFAFPGGITRESSSALDRALSDRRFLGDVERLEALAGDWTADEARPALLAALGVTKWLAPLAKPEPASVQLGRVLAFWQQHLRPLADDDPFAPRERRARAAIADTLSALAAVHAAHDDPPWTIDDVALNVRRWIEEQTFEPEAAVTGVHVIDDRAARYGEFDDVTIVGVIEPDWPERPRRNIFYPPTLLKSLGWPSEKDRRSAADAHFLDLLAGASRRSMVSVFTLDEDALVSRSIQLDEIPRAKLSSVARGFQPSDDVRVFVDEALSLEPTLLESLDESARAWATLRASRSPATAPEFHGVAGPPSARPWSVSALETYLDCPFKFFAQHVLRLEEEPDDEEVMDPRKQGQFVHQVFEQFFDTWQAAGHRAITPDNLDRARAVFSEVVDRALERLPDAEAGLERTRLLGSASAAGLGEAVMRMEAERPTPVVERLLEHKLQGEFSFATNDGPRTFSIRGKADRLDLLADGTFRLIDYKLGWPPDRSTALQLPIYALCAEQRLQSHRGKAWRLGEAVYLAFKGPRRVVPLFTNDAARTETLVKAQQRLADTVDKIAQGEFPPTPDDVWRCETCSFGSVCRKDYVGDV